ncbi:M15 family metallopeptidase [Haliangium ochraceum]|uniref:M15 family metallopeptidase n=1 Tax=Haliangium ochraceum TaxID=80816 RepID=UPI0018F02E55|nr:M15 family metallopeptidase [Haliangium ochraceum]
MPNHERREQGNAEYEPAAQRRPQQPTPGEVTRTSRLASSDAGPVPRWPRNAEAQPQPATSAERTPWRERLRPHLDAALGGMSRPAREDDAAGAVADEPGVDSADTVALTVEWRGSFGADISARLRVQGRNGRGADWVTLVEDAEVRDPDGVAGDGSAKLAQVFTLDRYAAYRVTFSPLAEEPDDRYRHTRAVQRVDASASAATLTRRLDVHRWNRKNVDDVWSARGIDPDKADDVVRASLFGRTVRVNQAVAPRVAQTNARYETLDEATKQEIGASLFMTGGYAVRTTRDGGYSNHSVGYAIDVNFHARTKQNHHFNSREMPLLTKLVEPVVQTDPAFATFAIRRDTGMDQLRAAQVFNERFPAYLANLLDLGEDAALLEQSLYMEKNLAYYEAYFRELRQQKARELFERVDGKMLREAIAAQTDPDKKAQLQLVLANWKALRAWLFGVTVRDKREKQDKRIVGMIPLHEDVLRLFLETGWDWGGDWRHEKDYMHFEDRQALAQVQLSGGTVP